MYQCTLKNTRTVFFPEKRVFFPILSFFDPLRPISTKSVSNKGTLVRWLHYSYRPHKYWIPFVTFSKKQKVTKVTKQTTPLILTQNTFVDL